jgi:hypothetical protein
MRGRIEGGNSGRGDEHADDEPRKMRAESDNFSDCRYQHTGHNLLFITPFLDSRANCTKISLLLEPLGLRFIIRDRMPLIECLIEANA